MEKLFIPYYRVSTDRQGQSGLGLEAQKRFIESYISLTGGNILDEFIDIESGGKASRAGLQKAITRCAKSNAVLVVSDIDRLSRDGFKVLSQINDAGITYIEAKSPNDNQFVKELKFLMAKDEREKISQRTKDALDSLRMRGVKLGRPQNFSDEGRMKGSMANRLKAIENDANKRAGFLTVKLRESGNLSFDDIVKQLNENGYRTPTGAEFKKGSVHRLYKRTKSILEEKKLSIDNVF